MSGVIRAFGLAAILSSALVSCGDGGDPRLALTVNLTTSSQAFIDPYQNDRLLQVRVEVDGPERQDAVAADVALDQRTAVFEDYPAGNEVTVRVGGYDEAGNLVAFGRVEGFALGEEEEAATIDVPFRRNLAFVIHHPDDPPQGRNTMYVIDVITRALVDRIKIGGPSSQDPIPVGISAIDGDGVAVSYCDQPAQECVIGLYSVNDGSWKKIPAVEVGASQRPAVAYSQIALGSGQRFGAAFGDGALSIFDTEALQVTYSQPVSGPYIDSALGRAGRVAVFTSRDNLLRVELDKAADDPARAIVNEIVLDGGCVGVDKEGILAYVATAEPAVGGGDQALPTVTSLDLVRGQKSVNSKGFAVSPLGPGVYSERMDSLACLMQVEEGDNTPEAVLAWSVFAKDAFPYSTSITVPPRPTDIAAAPLGRRLVVVSEGNDAASAGLTVIDTELNPDSPMDGSVTAYPDDPDDCEQVGTTVDGKPIEDCNNYRPTGIAILYGR